MKKRLIIPVLLFLFLVLPLGAVSFGYSQLVAFGDSLTDNGNFERATNGAVWVEYLADKLDVDLVNLAYAGARTDFHPASGTGEYGFNWQIDEYTKPETIDRDALYTIWIGGNDLLNMSATPEQVIGNAVGNISSGVKELVDAGAQNILVMNMPDLGKTPLMNGENLFVNEYVNGEPFLNNAAGGTYLSGAFNSQLSNVLDNTLEELNVEGLNLFQLDIFALMNQFIKQELFGNSENMLEFAMETGTYAGGEYLFWDAIHPTTFAHELIADAAYTKVAPVPEPATVILLGFGLFCLVGFRKKTIQR